MIFEYTTKMIDLFTIAISMNSSRNLTLFTAKKQYKSALNQSAKKKKSKYRNVKTEVHGLIFDSKKEAAHYLFLKSELDAGRISNLVLQPSFEIAAAVYIGGKKHRARKYKADFSYTNSAGEYVVEDVKGFKTDIYKLKKHLVMERHGIEVIEI